MRRCDRPRMKRLRPFSRGFSPKDQRVLHRASRSGEILIPRSDPESGFGIGGAHERLLHDSAVVELRIWCDGEHMHIGAEEWSPMHRS